MRGKITIAAAAALSLCMTVHAEELTLRPVTAGDVNGDGTVTVTDISLMAAHIKGIKSLDEVQLLSADADGSGTVNVTDISLTAAQGKGIKVIGETAELPPVTDSTPDDMGAEVMPSSKLIDVPCILQAPELPTGCEITSLTELLRYKGYDADKLTMARDYLPKQDFYYVGDVLYGADFHDTFAGDPETGWAYGCYAPCIVTAANDYLADCGSQQHARDLTGTHLSDLLRDYIANDEPVLIWITCGDLIPSSLTDSWYTPEGKLVQWRANEHCVLLTGYDLETGKVFAADPIAGSNSFDMALLEERFIEMGEQSVCIE